MRSSRAIVKLGVGIPHSPFGLFHRFDRGYFYGYFANLAGMLGVRFLYYEAEARGGDASPRFPQLVLVNSTQLSLVAWAATRLGTTS